MVEYEFSLPKAQRALWQTHHNALCALGGQGKNYVLYLCLEMHKWIRWF